jgi:hypothetical protein
VCINLYQQQTTPSKEGNWKALCSSFCLGFFPISKIVCLHLEILYFTQEEDESLIVVWEHFDNLVYSGPALSILDLVLLQHFYMGLDRKTSKYLNLASQGSFLHISTAKGIELLLNISQATPTYQTKQKFLEEEEF